MPQGYGFLRLSGLHSAEGDVYISASQIRRCELRPGDEVSGPAREPRRGESHRALVRVASVNGQEPEGERSEFEDLTPVQPHRRLPTAASRSRSSGSCRRPAGAARARRAGPGPGGAALRSHHPAAGARPCLRRQWRPRPRSCSPTSAPRRSPSGSERCPTPRSIAAPADTEPRDQVRAAELAIGHAKRRAEAGEDVAVIIDSLSRLALGYRDTSRVKRIFGAGRELEGPDSGSLTVIATVLEDDEKGRRSDPPWRRPRTSSSGSTRSWRRRGSSRRCGWTRPAPRARSSYATPRR